jgi:DNA-binding response OmpR family regulator
LVVGDAQLRKVVQIGFRLQCPESRVAVAADGPAALRAFDEQRPDVVLLDVALPSQDGFAVLREIRRQFSVSVIMLTAHGEELDQVRGLELGAVEYVLKPFSLLALLARIKAVLSRATLGAASAQPCIVVGDLAIDGQGHQVTLGGGPVPLTLVEYQMLSLLAQNACRTLPHQVLLDGVWGMTMTRHGTTSMPSSVAFGPSRNARSIHGISRPSRGLATDSWGQTKALPIPALELAECLLTGRTADLRSTNASPRRARRTG